MGAATRRIRSIVALASLSLTLAARRARRAAPLKQQWPWYHSSDELLSSLQELAGACAGADATLTALTRINSQEAAGQEVRLDVLRVRRRGVSARAKAMLVFGEHARELITGEAALGLAGALCGKGRSSQLANRVLDSVEFVLVPNANPLARRQVEGGDYCKRTNEDGVDLNRNWSDEHRNAAIPEGDEMYPGPGGFSEPETQLLRELIDQERPDIYLSVHSGAYLLGMPYGYEGGRPARDESAMLEVLRPISERFCGGGCPFGNLARLIHYDNPGCDIDYVYDRLGTPYVFTWEIFVGEEFRQSYLEEARAAHGGPQGREGPEASFAEVERRRLRRRGGSRQRARTPEAAEDVRSCMDQFNPQTEGETAAVVENWSAAFLELSAEVSLRRGGQAAASSPSALPQGPSLSGVAAPRTEGVGADGAEALGGFASDIGGLRAWDAAAG